MSFLVEIYPVLRMLWVVLFMALFLAIVFRVMRPSRRGHWDDAATIPFRDGGKGDV